MLKRSFAVFAVACLFAPAAFAAPAAKPAAQKQIEKPAPQKAAKPVKKVPAGTSANSSQEAPPGVRVQPAPGQAAKPAKPAPAKKAAAKPAKKKKQTAGKKESVKSGRAAASSSPVDGVDKNQLAVDHLKNAASKSPLDLLVSYKEVLADGDLETAAVLLRLAANEEPSHALVTRINDLLGIPLDTQDTQVLLEIARARRADTVIENVDEKNPADVASPVGARIHSVHEAVADAPRRSRLDALAIYKRAVNEENAEAAALALQGAVQGPVDQAAVVKANALLGIEAIIPVDEIAGNTP